MRKSKSKHPIFGRNQNTANSEKKKRLPAFGQNQNTHSRLKPKKKLTRSKPEAPLTQSNYKKIFNILYLDKNKNYPYSVKTWKHPFPGQEKKNYLGKIENYLPRCKSKACCDKGQNIL